MFRGRFIPSILITLVVIALLAAGAYALVQTGWSQGYLAGSAAASEGATAPVPIAPYRPAYFGFGFGFFPLLCGLGFLFLFGLFALRFLFFGRAFRAWRRAGGPGGENWHGHPKPWGPWGHWDEEQPEQEGAPESDPTEGEGGQVS